MIRQPGWRLAVGALTYLFCDIAVLWLAIYALGYEVPVAPLVLAYLIGYLANAIPIPGGIGVLDGGLAGALLLLSRSCVRRTGRSASVPRARSVDPSAFRDRRVHCRSAPDQLKRHQIHARARYRRLRPRYLDE